MIPHFQKTPDETKPDVNLESVEGYHPSSEDSAGLISSILFSFVGFYWWRTRNAQTDTDLLEKPSKGISAKYAAQKLERYVGRRLLMRFNFSISSFPHSQIPLSRKI